MPFRFENMWLKEESFKEVLRKWWEGIQVSGSAMSQLHFGWKVEGLETDFEKLE